MAGVAVVGESRSRPQQARLPSLRRRSALGSGRGAKRVHIASIRKSCACRQILPGPGRRDRDRLLRRAWPCPHSAESAAVRCIGSGVAMGRCRSRGRPPAPRRKRGGLAGAAAVGEGWPCPPLGSRRRPGRIGSDCSPVANSSQWLRCRGHPNELVGAVERVAEVCPFHGACPQTAACLPSAGWFRGLSPGKGGKGMDEEGKRRDREGWPRLLPPGLRPRVAERRGFDKDTKAPVAPAARPSCWRWPSSWSGAPRRELSGSRGSPPCRLSEVDSGI